MRVVVPIDPLKRKRYVKTVNSEGQGNYLDQLYNFMSSIDDYINATMDGNLSWQSVTSCTSDSDEALEI